MTLKLCGVVFLEVVPSLLKALNVEVQLVKVWPVQVLVSCQVLNLLIIFLSHVIQSPAKVFEVIIS